MHFHSNLIYQSSTLFFLALIPPDTEQIRVNVLDKNDSPPKFQNLPLVFSVSEDLAVGQTVARITATDPDTLGKLEYALLDGDAPKKFALERETGLLKLRDTLDRETEDSYRLKVSVTDGIQSTETTITIQVGSFFFFWAGKPSGTGILGPVPPHTHSTSGWPPNGIKKAPNGSEFERFIPPAKHHPAAANFGNVHRPLSARLLTHARLRLIDY